MGKLQCMQKLMHYRVRYICIWDHCQKKSNTKCLQKGLIDIGPRWCMYGERSKYMCMETSKNRALVLDLYTYTPGAWGDTDSGHETDGAISEHQSINTCLECQPMAYTYFIWWQVAI